MADDDPAPPPSDAAPTRELLEGYLRGDGAAERRLFARHRALLAARARAHPLGAALAPEWGPEDLADEALLRALAGGFFERFEPRASGSLRNALFRVLDRVVADAHRRQAALKRGAGWAQVEVEVEVADAPSATGEARLRELLAIALRELPQREWEAWRLVDAGGLDAVEAATHCGATPAAVRGLVRRARARLLRALAGRR